MPICWALPSTWACAHTGTPVVYAAGADTGRAENAGFDAFVPLINSGIAAYFWTGPRFLSVVL